MSSLNSTDNEEMAESCRSAQKLKKVTYSSSERVASRIKKLKRTLRKTYSNVDEGTGASSSQSLNCPNNSLTLPSKVTETHLAELRANVPDSQDSDSSLDEVEQCATTSSICANQICDSDTPGQYVLAQNDDNTTPVEDYNETPGIAEDVQSVQPDPEDKHVYINMSELFEKPNVNLLSILPNSSVPCLMSAPGSSGLENQLSPNDKQASDDVCRLAMELKCKDFVKSRESHGNSSSAYFQYSDPYFPSLMQDSIREMALDGQFSDVTLQIDDHRFLCHRMILAASSKYFRAMFCNDYKERNQPSVTIRGVSSDVMKILIRYSYTSFLEINRESVQSVLEAASLLQFERVLEACSNYFVGELDVENAPGIMELAHTHNLHHLLVLARLKCVTCFDQLQEKSDIVVLSTELLETLVCRGDLMIHYEEQVFQLVMFWCQHSPEKRKPHLPKLLKHVKFPLIDPAYFVTKVEPHPFIKNNPDLFDFLMEARRYRTIGDVTEGSRIVPRQSALVHQVFVTVGGCDKDDKFIGEVSVLDFQHKTRATLCQLPNSSNSTRRTSQSNGNNPANPANPERSKWAEFGCVSWKNNIVISGGKESRKEAWMFITSLRQWVELGGLNTGRWRHRMVTCGGYMYVVGGYDGLLRVDSLEKYNSRENRWKEQRHMREGVSSAAVCECDQMIYVIGGGPSVRISSEKVQVYDPTNDLWRFSTSMPEPAKCINAVSYNRKIYVVGGTLKRLLRLDVDSAIWEQVGEKLTSERASCGVTLCSDKIFIVGGRDETGKVMSNVSYLDTDSNVIRSECNVPCGISHHGCITLQKYDQIRSKMV